jgi:hypothetical protein
MTTSGRPRLRQAGGEPARHLGRLRARGIPWPVGSAEPPNSLKETS